MKAIGIVGYHHTGKTTMAVAVIRELTQRGYKVASIKDIHNESYRADSEGSNSWKHAKAGATQVFARGLQDSALILTPSPDLKDIIPLLTADFLVIEGMKHAALPKIVCAETTGQLDELIDETTIGISGKIASELESYHNLPVYCLQNNLEQLINDILTKTFEILPQSDPDCCSACGKSCFDLAADIVQGRAKREDCVLDGKKRLRLYVNDREIVIVPFVQNMLKDVISAMTDNLNGIDPSGTIRIEIKR
ncbi:MAG: molybdopterin-guanine dinucleotide biosynthesis protein B [Candidatus Cloacimonadaceae bacterium]|nr:molybdopterin-guanine dinucleotide biosynthesis protein B [Candidatus Cloacimonadaceae bacterium]